ncbi:MAG TPA: nitrilase-related carbon-nitrogen hydrolase [Gemmatimonadaceae bacterium]
MTSPGSLRVALGEYDIGWHDPGASLDIASRVVSESAARGARLVVLPEMCTCGFTMDVGSFAEPLNGEQVARLSRMARSADVWLIAGVPTRSAEQPVRPARNSALVFAPSGTLAGVYHKQRLFAYADEQRSYQAGDEPIVLDVDGVRVSPFICYDLRFPELFRRIARRTDLIVVIASWPAARRAHWDVLLRARAIENQCYVIGVNRSGEGGSVSYDGGSAAYDPWGAPLDHRATPGGSGVATVTVSASEVERIRSAYPFLVDAACA